MSSTAISSADERPSQGKADGPYGTTVYAVWRLCQHTAFSSATADKARLVVGHWPYNTKSEADQNTAISSAKEQLGQDKL
jgi:hypothetical protein